MKLKSSLVCAFCALLFACGGGSVPNPDAGVIGPDTRPTDPICLDNDGDGVPGTGDCAAQAKVDCNDADPKISPDATESCNGVDDDCDQQVDEGLPVLSYYRDQDGDGYGSIKLGEGCKQPSAGSVSNDLDCNDLNPEHKPGATETCDGLDEDCDGAPDDGLTFRDFYEDQDFDGYGAASGAAQSSCLLTVSGRVPNNQDCNDTSGQIRPGAAELCNKVDDNCDGQLDNGITYLDYYPDKDGDSYGDKTAAAENSCSLVVGKVANNTDCNDAAPSIKPGAQEQCNATDDNCNGQTDEGLVYSIYYPDTDGDGFGSATGQPTSSCKPLAGKVTNSQDCNDANSAIKPTAPEVCNGLDDDCDGPIDDGLTFTNYYVDADGDGYGSASGTAQNSCSPLPGRVTNNQDCNDGSNTVKPGAAEVCNQQDDNCVGGVDEGLPTQSWWVDVDADGFGAQGSTAITRCGSTVTGRVTNNNDCNDSNAAIKPSASESCNGVDDNCNGSTDEGLATQSYYPDLDGDTYGSSSATAQLSCRAVSGKVTNKQDCNDGNAAIHPAALESCNSIDDNCDTLIDNGVTTQAYYVDGDADGYGAKGTTAINSCSAISGRVTNDGDCNDSNSAVKPSATESCNGVDDNCSGAADEGLTFTNYYPDLDSDGFGAQGSSPQSSCSAVSGKVTNAQDCNDNNVNIKPGATEVCNGTDDDCANGVDDGLTFTNYYPDVDGDTYGAAAATPQSACAPPGGKVTNNQDCNDGSSSIKPGATEACNNVDDNCAGGVDEGNPGGGGTCVTGQQGVCAAGTLTCQAGSMLCLRKVEPSNEVCDGLDNDCEGGTDEDYPNKDQECVVGKGVCQRTGLYVCKADKSGTECSGTPGEPTAAACDSLDNDCDGIADEPALISTSTLHTTAWNDLEVAPYYFSDGGCQGGALGSGSDALSGGALVMSNGASGIYFQQLDTQGAPVGAARSIATYAYSDIAIAQAGAGFIVAGIWLDKEIDLYYVDPTGTKLDYEYTEFVRAADTNVLEGLRLVRGNGKRVTLVWRESNVGIKTARVEPFNTTGTWQILTPSQAVAPFPATTVVANTAVMAGVGADSSHQDWVASQTCASTTSLRQVSVAYVAPVDATNHSLRRFTMSEDGTNKSADQTLESDTTANYTLGEPDLAFFRSSAANHWMVAFTESYVGSNAEDLRFWMSTLDAGTALPFEYVYSQLARENGADSITRPRVSITSSYSWVSAIRYVTDASGNKRQVMTRKILFNGAKDPASTTVEVSATAGACDGGVDCRDGNKNAITNWAPFGKVYYSSSGSSAGSHQSTLTCQ